MNELEKQFLLEVSKELKEQETDCQANPRFWVVAQYEYIPCWDEQADEHYYYDTEGDKYEKFSEVLDMLLENGYIESKKDYDELDDLDGIYDEITLVPVKKEHIIIQNTFFLSKRECQEHIKRNHYHYNSTVHTYAMTAWRSPQVERLLNILFNLTKEKPNER